MPLNNDGQQHWDSILSRRQSDFSHVGRRDSTGSLARRGSLLSTSLLDFPLTPAGRTDGITSFGYSTEPDPFAPLSFSEPLPLLSPTVLSRPTGLPDRLLGDRSEASIPSVISAGSYSTAPSMPSFPNFHMGSSVDQRRSHFHHLDNHLARHNPITPVHSMNEKQKLSTMATSLPSTAPITSLSMNESYDDSQEDGGEDDNNHRFKPFHEEKWSLRYKELLEFHKQHGHAAVPHTYPPNPQLARWVKRQRRQYKLRKDNRQSTMTTERLDMLASVGFIWDSHDVNWREKLDTLISFRKENGHCNVPSNYTDKKLATWVKCQRRQYKLYWDGKPSAMSPERILELEKVGFEWEIRSTVSRNGSSKPSAARIAATAAAAAPVADAAPSSSALDHADQYTPFY